jgi:putative peptide zinc metalloprotease protein
MIMPMFKWFKYLATSDELARTRRLAVITTLLFLGTIITVIGFIPFPDRERAPAVIEPEVFKNLFMQADGIVTDTRESGTRVSKGDWLIKASNEELVAQHKEVVADLKLAEAQARLGVAAPRGYLVIGKPRFFSRALTSGSRPRNWR